MLLINDLVRHSSAVSDLIGEAVQRVLSRGWYILGPEVEAFEREWADYTGARFAVTVANGTEALELALKAVGIGQDDRVATVANAGMYSTTAIRACGAEPVYVDVLESSMNMDPEALESALPQVQAVIVTHLYGLIAAMPRLAEIAARAGVPLIEDCAQAHGARLDGKHAGTWGVAGCFSFYPTKNLGAIGDGGAVITASPEVDAKLRSLRQYGWSSKYIVETPGGRNSRLDDVQAAVLRAKLPLLDSWNLRRRQIARAYGLLPDAPEESYVAHLCVLRHPDRDRLRAHLRDRGIATDIHYPVPDHRQKPWRAAAILPVTERLCREIVTVPCFPEMTDREIEGVRTAISALETAGRSYESNSV